MKGVNFKFDTSHVQNILTVGGKKGLFAAAHHIAHESQKQVPLDKGTLLHSQAVDVGEDMAVISYDTPYAVRVHEKPESKFQRGRKGKYLEDPVNDPANWDRVMRHLAEEMKL